MYVLHVYRFQCFLSQHVFNECVFVVFLLSFTDAEEEEDSPQFEPPPGGSHRLGDGLTRTPTALRVHQVRPLILRSFTFSSPTQTPPSPSCLGLRFCYESEAEQTQTGRFLLFTVSDSVIARHYRP